MSGTDLLGEFEQLVLLAVLQNHAEAYALPIRRAIEEVTERAVSRGALYRTLDRPGAKGMVSWEFEDASEARGGNPRKQFEVTAKGLSALQRSRSVVEQLSAGLEDVLEVTR